MDLERAGLRSSEPDMSLPANLFVIDEPDHKAITFLFFLLQENSMKKRGGSRMKQTSVSD